MENIKAAYSWFNSKMFQNTTKQLSRNIEEKTQKIGSLIITCMRFSRLVSLYLETSSVQGDVPSESGLHSRSCSFRINSLDVTVNILALDWSVNCQT